MNTDVDIQNVNEVCRQTLRNGYSVDYKTKRVLQSEKKNNDYFFVFQNIASNLFKTYHTMISIQSINIFWITPLETNLSVHLFKT